MTAEEMRAEREALERDIANRVNEFAVRVGLPVESIRVDLMEWRELAGPARSQVSRVDVVVRL